MDRHPNGWEVGMRVWVVYDRQHGRGTQREEAITKIGRRWITLEGRDRFDADTMRLDGGQFSSPGRVWPSKAEYEEQTEVAKAWSELIRRLSHTPPAGMTLQRIAELQAELTAARAGKETPA